MAGFFSEVDMNDIKSVFNSFFKLKEKFNTYGYALYLVGGSLRDYYLGKESSDIDCATNATPDEMSEFLSEYPLMKIGKHFGTVGLFFEDQMIEITTFRSESVYSDHRRPDEVHFSQDINEDLKRRDFTINAMAYSDKLLDPYNGMQDIKKRIIRAVGDPNERFKEDALRILRALRFSCELGFEIEKETYEAMREHQKSLKFLSTERVAKEVSKALLGDFVLESLFNHTEIWDELFPGLLRMKAFDQQCTFHQYDLLTHTAKCVANTPKDLVLRFAALFHDFGKLYTQSFDENHHAHYYSHHLKSEELAKDFLKYMNASKKSKKEVLALIHEHDSIFPATKKSVSKKMRKLGKDTFFRFLILQRADRLAQGYNQTGVQMLDEIEKIAKEIIETTPELSRRDLMIDGRDLIRLGYAGAEIGVKFEEILQKVLVGDLKNEKDEIMKYLRSQE